MTAWQTIRETPRRLGEAAAQARPSLRSVNLPPHRMTPTAFALLVVGLFFAGMVGMLVLTTELQNQAFAMRAAQQQASELGYRASDLEARVNRAVSPAALGQQAASLGMVPNPHAVFIDLSTGEVLGEPVPVRGDEIPSLTRQPMVVDPADEVPTPDASTAGASGEVPPPDAPKANETAQAAPPDAVEADPAGPVPPAEATGAEATVGDTTAAGTTPGDVADPVPPTGQVPPIEAGVTP